MRGSRTAGRCRVSVVDEIRCGSGGRGIGVVVVSGMFTGDEKKSEHDDSGGISNANDGAFSWAPGRFFRIAEVTREKWRRFVFLGGFFMVTFMNSELQTNNKKR